MATTKRPIIIAVDGPAGSGKTTIARALARRLGFTEVDTGAIYRTAALLAERRKVPLDDEETLTELLSSLEISFEVEGGRRKVLLGDEDISDEIRRHEISTVASKISAWPKVRAGLLDLQRRLALESPRKGAVLEGRDIGTVVFPDADVKLFLTATPEERARRRHLELAKKGFDVPWEKVAADQAARDEQDSRRAVAPLAPAEDAIVFDSTNMEVEEVVGELEALVRDKVGSELTERNEP